MVMIPGPMFPKEHGSWAIVLLPMLVGTIVSDRFSGNSVFLALAVLSVFMAYVPAHTLLRHRFGTPQSSEKKRSALFWGSAYCIAAITFSIPLFVSGFWVLAPIALLGVSAFFGSFFLARTSRSIAADLTSVAGLALGAPAAYYVGSGRIDNTALMLWILSVLFFGCSVFYVHMKIRAIGMKNAKLSFRQRIRLGWMNLLYHIVMIAVVLFLTLQHYTPQLAILAFVPITFHAVYGTLRLSGMVTFKNLGLLLLAQSIGFGVLIAVTFAGGA